MQIFCCKTLICSSSDGFGIKHEQFRQHVPYSEDGTVTCIYASCIFFCDDKGSKKTPSGRRTSKVFSAAFLAVNRKRLRDLPLLHSISLYANCTLSYFRKI